jgi:glycosyltransferase 2 family protein
MRRRWVLWLLMILFLWWVVRSLPELKVLVITLSGGQWQWILAAVVLQVGYYTLYGMLYQAAFHTVAVERRLRDLLTLFFAAMFMDVAAPSGGASAAALYFDEAAQSGHSPGRTAAGVLLARLADFSTFMVVLLAGLMYLSLQDALQVYEVVSAAILVAIISAMSGVLLLGGVNPALLRRILGRIQRIGDDLAGRLRLRTRFAADWAERHSTEFTEAALAIAAHPSRWVRLAVTAMGIYVAHVTCLYVLFQAFQVRIGFGPLLAGYGVGMLMWVVSITPHGVGVVEGVMTLLYVSLGVPAQAAAVVVLAFRGLTFWLPLGLGFFMMRRLQSFKRVD